MAWAACVVSITALGLSGILAEGCGGDDNAPGTGGTAGTGGSGGGTGGKGGSTNTGGGGTTGGGGSGGAMDAGIDAQAVCSAAINSGSMCADKCICDNCAKQAVACFADPNCRALVDCANRMGCAGLDAVAALQCAQMKCPGELADASMAQLAAATGFGNCVAGANCTAKCAPDGSTEGGGDAKPDTSTDSPAADSPAADSPAADSPAADSTTADSTTSDATTTEAGGD
jgi:hypothetical protein